MSYIKSSTGCSRRREVGWEDATLVPQFTVLLKKKKKKKPGSKRSINPSNRIYAHVAVCEVSGWSWLEKSSKWRAHSFTSPRRSKLLPVTVLFLGSPGDKDGEWAAAQIECSVSLRSSPVGGRKTKQLPRGKRCPEERITLDRGFSTSLTLVCHTNSDCFKLMASFLSSN